jgi:hypothetical protein
MVSSVGTMRCPTTTTRTEPRLTCGVNRECRSKSDNRPWRPRLGFAIRSRNSLGNVRLQILMRSASVERELFCKIQGQFMDARWTISPDGARGARALEFGHFLLDTDGYLWPSRCIDGNSYAKRRSCAGKRRCRAALQNLSVFRRPAMNAPAVLECGTPVPLCEATGGCLYIGRFCVATMLIPSRLQDESKSLVICASGFVAHSLQIAAEMRLARVRTDKSCPRLRAASPEAQIPVRLNLILKATWNYNP